MSSRPSFKSAVSSWSHRVHDPDALLVAADANLDEASGPVRAEVEHNVIVFVSDHDPVAERVADVFVVDTVLARAGSDRRVGHVPWGQGYVDAGVSSRSA